MITVPVALGARSYDVVVGQGARHRLAATLPAGVRRAAVVTQERVGWAVDPGVESRCFTIGEGEGAKSLATVEELCRGFAGFGLTRGDVVVGVGGGVVTDVAGFAAACWHRGVAVVHVATTLLAQVDAAIGGKCGVNLPEGKNLVGAFWQPAAVLCDTEILSTLPAAEYRSGLGEMAKYAFLGVEDLATLPLDEQVAACVASKAAAVAADEREGGRRALLNYGHTLAHALEAAGWAAGAGGAGGPPDGTGGTRLGLRHGEAVAVGLVFVARLARRLGRIGDARVEEHQRLVDRYGLPSRLPEGVDPARLVELMGRDKKAVEGLTFVLDGPDGVEVVAGVDRADVLAALAEVART
ncbi:MAG: 3-dehydroquinate synthase family protein [Acidimicrobiales bacterium]